MSEVSIASGPAVLSIQVQVEGWHSWPDAPAHRAYLRHPHRHLFGVAVEVMSLHDERELEFHDLMDETRQRVAEIAPGGQFGPMSCETIARRLACGFAEAYGRRFLVTVGEDGECSSTVEAWPEQAAAAA